MGEGIAKAFFHCPHVAVHGSLGTAMTNPGVMCVIVGASQQSGSDIHSHLNKPCVTHLLSGHKLQLRLQ